MRDPCNKFSSFLVLLSSIKIHKYSDQQTRSVTIIRSHISSMDQIIQQGSMHLGAAFTGFHQRWYRPPVQSSAVVPRRHSSKVKSLVCIEFQPILPCQLNEMHVERRVRKDSQVELMKRYLLLRIYKPTLWQYFANHVLFIHVNHNCK